MVRGPVSPAVLAVDPSAWLEPLLPALRSPAGAVAFVPLYALWVTLLLPGVWASMLAGALYGTVLASVIVFVGASLGALAAFLLGRHWWRGWTRTRANSCRRAPASASGGKSGGFKIPKIEHGSAGGGEGDRSKRGRDRSRSRSRDRKKHRSRRGRSASRSASRRSIST